MVRGSTNDQMNLDQLMELKVRPPLGARALPPLLAVSEARVEGSPSQSGG